MKAGWYATKCRKCGKRIAALLAIDTDDAFEFASCSCGALSVIMDCDRSTEEYVYRKPFMKFRGYCGIRQMHRGRV